MRCLPLAIGAAGLALTLSACTAPAATTSTSGPAPAGPTAASTPALTPTAAPTPSATPTPAATAGATGYGAWCDALPAQQEAVAETLGHKIAGVRPAQVVQPQDNEWEENRSCSVVFGNGDFESPRFTVSESRYSDEADAGADFARFGQDDGDPMVATLDAIDVAGEPAWYVTYVNRMGVPPGVSYSVTFQEEDRVVRIAYRHTPEDMDTLEPGQGPADEADRRQQVLEAVELLRG